MAGKISELTELAEAPATDDELEILDVSDTSLSPAGTNKRVSVANLLAGAAVSRVLIEEIENLTAGEFDFDSIPGDYSRLILQGVLRGDDSVTSESVHLYLNDDLTDGNYHRQENRASNGAAVVSEGASPRVAVVSGDSSPANKYGSIQIIIEDYAGSYAKNMLSSFGVERDSDDITTGMVFVASAVTAAITRLRVRTDNHATDQLFGKLALYGEH